MVQEFAAFYKERVIEHYNCSVKFIYPFLDLEESNSIIQVLLATKAWDIKKSMHLIKALGLIGCIIFFILFYFFQRYWNLIGEDVTRMIQNVF